MSVFKRIEQLDVRTILVIVISLSTIAVIKQGVTTQLLISITTLILLILKSRSLSITIGLLKRLKRLWAAVVTVMAFQILFRRGGEVIFTLFLFSFTEVGVSYALSVGLRLINIALIAGLLFGISTSEYLLAFKSWRLPYEISFIITSVIRFIPDFFDLYNLYQESLYLRGISFKRLNLKQKLKGGVTLLTAALVQALNDVNSRAIALELKGFRRYPNRTYLREKALNTQDHIVQILAVLTLLFSIVT